MSTERQTMQDYLDALAKRDDFPAYFTLEVVDTHRWRRPAGVIARPGHYVWISTFTRHDHCP